MAERKMTRRRMIAATVGGAGLGALAPGGVFSGARAQTTSKTFVLVHGAWLGGWCWRRVSDVLEKKGHKVFSPTLTGLGERSHLMNKDINLDTHISDIVNLIKSESLTDVCLVAHSYGGWPASAALEQLEGKVSAVVWVDAFKPENGQKPIDFTALGKKIAELVEKGEMSIPAIKAAPVLVNANDSAWFDSKVTAQPIGTYLQPITLSGALQRIAKKTYLRAPRFPAPALDKALAECKADKTWNTAENGTSGHCVMIDAPDWLADQILKAV